MIFQANGAARNASVPGAGPPKAEKCAMSQTLDPRLSWIRTGGTCGILSIASYLAAAFAPLPDTLGYAAAFAFGPLLAIGFLGLYQGLGLERKGPLLQIAAAFSVGAGFTVLIMLTTQQAIFGVLRAAGARSGAAVAPEVAKRVAEGLNAVHYGIDVAWDVLISTAVILFSVAMLRHPRFGRLTGGLGIALGALLLGFNLWFFPVPPASAESIDWGPFVALWMLANFVLLLRSRRWAEEVLAGAIAPS